MNDNIADAQAKSGPMGEKPKARSWSYCCDSNGYFAGGMMVLVGGYFLAKEMGWISSHIPFWPLAVIAVGLWMILKRR